MPWDPDRPWELINMLAVSIENGNMPVLDVGGKSAEVAAVLHAIAAKLYADRTVAQALRDGAEGVLPTGTLGDRGRPTLDGDILRFHVGKIGAPCVELGFTAAWVPVTRLRWLASTVGSNISEAYQWGRGSMRREAQEAAKGVAELLGVKMEWR